MRGLKYMDEAMVDLSKYRLEQLANAQKFYDEINKFLEEKFKKL
jgi:hypothetical protein